MSSRRLGLTLLLVAAVVNELTVSKFLGLETGAGLGAVRLSILSFQLIAALAGVLLVASRRVVHKGYLIIVPLCLIVLLAGAELIAGMALSRGRSPLRRTSESTGWETTPNVRLTYTNPAFGLVRVTTGPHGFRRWDRFDPGAIRVFAIGDSYTEALQVSDGQAWFDHLARLAPTVSIFAYGTGGYGTLQEYMMLDRHVDSIRPDVIVWQLSANDLINNDFFLETKNPAGSRMTRPFFENGRIVNRFPSASEAVRYSRLVRFISARMAMLQGHGFSPASIATERTKYPRDLERAIATTGSLMKLARERTGDIPIFAFAAEGDSYADSVLASAATASGWSFIPGIRDSIDAARSRGTRVDGMPRDGHWNAAGHSIAGRVMARHLISGGILRKHHRGNDRNGQDTGDNDQ
jgi:hypothetical protein